MKYSHTKINIYTNSNIQESYRAGGELGTWPASCGEALGTGFVLYEGGSGVLAQSRSLVSGHMKAEVVWLGRHCRPCERPHLTPVWKCAGWGALPYSPESQQVGHLHWHCLPTHLRVVCQAATAVPAIDQFGKGHSLWDQDWLFVVIILVSTQPLAPLRPPCSEGRKATGLLPALGRGRQRSAAVMATEC